MSLYDTENLMQTTCSLLGDNCLLIDVDIFKDEINSACKIMQEYDPTHYRTANKYCKRDGNNTKTRLDYILGVDNIMECELEDGTLLFVAIDWTDDPMKLEEKRDRFTSRKVVMDSLGMDICLSVCVSNQVRLTRKIDKARFASAALYEILLKVEDMYNAGRYAGYLELNMNKLIK